MSTILDRLVRALVDAGDDLSHRQTARDPSIYCLAQLEGRSPERGASIVRLPFQTETVTSKAEFETLYVRFSAVLSSFLHR